MLSASVEQRVSIKFLTKLGKSATETYNLLTEVCGDQCLSHMQVFEWFKKFKEGREYVRDDPKLGRPSTAKTQENVEKVARIVQGDCRLSIRAISELKESVRQILDDDLDMKKVCAKVVPKIFTREQKEHRVNCCADTLENIENDPDFFLKVITCDKTWIFQYDPETKRQSMHWKSPQSPRKKKAHMSKFKFKAMMIVFFDIRGVIYIDWVPEDQTVNQVYYKNVLTTLHECVQRRRPDMWKNASWILHHDNAPSVKRYLAKNNIPVTEHPPYSPDLAPCDFFLFPKIKSVLKGTKFESVDAVKGKETQLLNSLKQDDLQHCYQHWQIRMERCRDRGGDYIEGDNISIV